MEGHTRPVGRGRSKARGGNPPPTQQAPPQPMQPQGAWARRPGSALQPDTGASGSSSSSSSYGPPPV